MPTTARRKHWPRSSPLCLKRSLRGRGRRRARRCVRGSDPFLRLLQSRNVRLELLDDVFQLFIHDQVIEEIGASLEEGKVVQCILQAFSDLRLGLPSARAQAKSEGAQHRAATASGWEQTAGEN